MELSDDDTGGFGVGAGNVLMRGTLMVQPADIAGVYVRVTVDQPQSVLPLGGVNRWSLQLRSRGHYRVQMQELPPGHFVEGTNTGAAVSVLGRLTQSLVPSTFQASAAARLYVFFQPEQSSGYGGHVRVAAPRSFHFGSSCGVQRLPEAYYRIANDKQDAVYLPVVQSCVGLCTHVDGCEGTSLNTAKILLENPVLPEFAYGFELSLQNPAAFSITDEASWQIWTTDAFDRPLDAANPAKLNPEGGLAWGVFQEGTAVMSSLSLSSLWPSAVTGASVLLTLILQVTVSFTATARFISPVGFNMDPSTFQSMSVSVAGAEADWPGSLLSGTAAYDAEPQNTLLWSAASYGSGQVIGFSVPRLKERVVLFCVNLNPCDKKMAHMAMAFLVATEVPRFPVATMWSAGVLQFGWDAATLAERPLALVLPMEQVRSIINFRVDYLSNVVAARQRIYVSLETMSDIPIGGRLLLTAPSVFDFQSLCSVLAVPGEAPPSGWETLVCEAFAGEITLRPKSQELVAGVIRFALDVWNPDEPLTSRTGHATPCGHENCWKVEIYNTVGGQLDAPAYTASFPVNVAMPHAQLVDLNTAQRYATGRNDRPGQRNKLIFAFSLALSAASGTLRIIGPFGFAFDQDCLPGLSTAHGPGGVFGTLGSLPGFHAWETAAQVTVMNPLELPDPNTWSLECLGSRDRLARESAVSFPSFTVWSFTESRASRRDGRALKREQRRLTGFSGTSISDANVPPNPVTLRFRPHKDVRGDPAGGGMLRLSVPDAYAVARKSDGACEAGKTRSDAGPLKGVAQDACKSRKLLRFRSHGPSVSEATDQAFQKPWTKVL
ncbi:Hypothetical protein SCF082_LOCUS19937 [Durusdinium trenchii]|uniref:Uncharacterized protein n=1 Tax=Durusdinium trenchii TaxID=1381693 RepID=A0ABP0L1L2_9DINO